MNLKFGPAIDSKTGGADETLHNLQKSLSFSDEVVELSFTALDRVVYSKEIVKTFRKFKYRSIHLPVVKIDNGEKIFLSYPNIELEPALQIVDKLIDEGKPNVVLIHPDQVTDFDWVYKKYGNLLAFENMDKGKSFGNTVNDLENVFKLCPNSKWVFDLNHIYTNDPSMKLAEIFFDKFKDRLTHYHLSGYGGFHDALCLSKEDVILKGIISFDYPIVDEGNLILKNVLEKEYEYIISRLP